MTAPSRTARRVAERRAAHQILDVPLVLHDPLAIKIAGLTKPEDRERLVALEQGRLSRTLRAFMAARSRVAEDELARRAAEGLRQYVILGAGLDTFAYRNPFAGHVHVFEVDQAATQAWKRERLAEAGIEAGAGVSYVTLDLETDDLLAGLTAGGWNPRLPTLFSWLGVTMYLQSDSVMSVLRAIGRQATGTTVVCDYVIAPGLLGPVERLVFDEFAKRVAGAGEPWISMFEPEALAGALRACGFTEVEDLGADELNARYFAGRSDGMRVGTLARVVRARV